ncbi:DUF177 domain-containing protein [soil metagenome]
MLIDLTTTKISECPFDITLTPDEVNLDSEEAALKNVVKVKGNLKKGIAQTDVEGEIFADIEIECSRCLTSAESSLEIVFDAAFVTPENYTEAKEAELGVEDLEVSIIEDDQIDLTELVREQILLNLPTQIFCQENCQGLCPKC